MRRAGLALACAVLLLSGGSCGKPASDDFQRLASVHVSGYVHVLSVDDEGVVTLTENQWRYEDPHSGPAWCTATLHRVYPDGRVESKTLPSLFEMSPILTVEGDRLVFPEDGNRVTYLDTSTFATRTVEDERLAELTRMRSGPMYFFDSGLVVYPIVQGYESGGLRACEGAGVYDPALSRDLRLLTQGRLLALSQGYAIIESSGFFYALTMEGEQKYKLAWSQTYTPDRVVVTPYGLVAGGIDSAVSDLHKPVVVLYPFSGERQIPCPMPDTDSVGGDGPAIAALDGIVATSLFNMEELGEPGSVYGQAYLGYFDSETGQEIYSVSNRQKVVTFCPLDNLGYYYLHPSTDDWKSSPGGRIALFHWDEEIASMDYDATLQAFASSANGHFFAVVSEGGTVSSYCLTKDLPQ